MGHGQEPRVEDERPARPHRPPALRGPVRARRQQLHADVPGPRAVQRPAALRHRVGLVGALVRRIDLRAPGAEHRPHDQLLPAEQVRRRPRVQGRLPLAHGARRVDQPHRRQRGRALLELDDDLRRLRRRLQLGPLPRRRDELQPEHERALRPGRLHGEAPDAEPRRALGSSVGRGACRRSRGEPAHPDDHAGDQLPRPRAAASRGTTSRRAWA